VHRNAPARLTQQQPAKRVVAGEGSTPPITTLPISPPAWQPTTVIVRCARKTRLTVP
jgi:hypothetical protein